MPEVDHTETPARDAPLVALFGRPARVKIVSVLVEERNRELGAGEIARRAGVASDAVSDHLDALEVLGVATRSGETDAAQRYRLANTDIADRLCHLEGLLLRRLLDLAYESTLDE